MLFQGNLQYGIWYTGFGLPYRRTCIFWNIFQIDRALCSNLVINALKLIWKNITRGCGVKKDFFLLLSFDTKKMRNNYMRALSLSLMYDCKKTKMFKRAPKSINHTKIHHNHINSPHFLHKTENAPIFTLQFLRRFLTKLTLEIDSKAQAKFHRLEFLALLVKLSPLQMIPLLIGVFHKIATSDQHCSWFS